MHTLRLLFQSFEKTKLRRFGCSLVLAGSVLNNKKNNVKYIVKSNQAI